jgi:hypothetical protein
VLGPDRQAERRCGLAIDDEVGFDRRLENPSQIEQVQFAAVNLPLRMSAKTSRLHFYDIDPGLLVDAATLNREIPRVVPAPTGRGAVALSPLLTFTRVPAPALALGIL